MKYRTVTEVDYIFESAREVDIKFSSIGGK